MDGILQSEGEPLSVLSMGGVSQFIPKSSIAPKLKKDGKTMGLEVNKMTRSLMMTPDQLGLSAQDVADIVAWLATYR